MANAVDVRHKPSQNLDINENKSSAHPDDDPTSRVSFRENGSSGGPMAGQDRRKDGLSTTEAPAGDRRRASREKGEEKGVDPPRSTAVAAAAGIRVRGATGFAGTEVDSTTTEDDSEEWFGDDADTPGDVTFCCQWFGDDADTPGDVTFCCQWFGDDADTPGDVTFCCQWFGDDADTPGDVTFCSWFGDDADTPGDVTFCCQWFGDDADTPGDVTFCCQWFGDDADTPGDVTFCSETAGLEKSSSFQRSVARKQRVRQGEEGGPRQDRLQPEPDGQQQRHRLTKLGSSDSLSEAFSTMGSDPSSPSNLNTGKTLGPRPAVTPRRTLRTGGEAERSPEGGKPTEDWKPFSDPEAALRAAHRKMENDDWEVKTEGLNMTRRIVHFHPETFGAPPVLHSTILLVVREVKNLRSQVSRQAIVCVLCGQVKNLQSQVSRQAIVCVLCRQVKNLRSQVSRQAIVCVLCRQVKNLRSQVSRQAIVCVLCRQVKNLRSQVSRQAIVCLGDMFGSLGKAMDPDVDIVACQLLAKAGESNNFIRDDVERSLCAMVEGVAPKQALLALIGGGASHKNIVVRRTAAQFLVGLVERMGSGRILSGVKDITERVLPATAQFVLDGSPETRYYGRKILHLLMPHQDFSRMLTRHLPPNTLRNVQDVVDSLKNKGLGEKPNETASARSRRSGQGSRMGSSLRRSSANSADLFSNTPPTRRRPARTDEATMNEIKTLTDQLSSSEWRVRYDAVTAFQDLCVERPHTVSLHMVKILDKLLPLVQAANSKVSLQALRALQAAVPHVQEALQAVASMAVAAVAPNLASKNRPIADTARSILDSFLQHLDQAVLIQPLILIMQCCVCADQPVLIQPLILIMQCCVCADQAVLIQPFANQAQCAAGHSKAEMVLKVACKSVEMVLKVACKSVEMVLKVACKSVEMVLKVACKSVEMVLKVACKSVEMVLKVACKSVEMVLKVACKSVEMVLKVACKSVEMVLKVACKSVEMVLKVACKSVEMVLKVACKSVEMVLKVACKSVEMVLKVACKSVEMVLKVACKSVEMVLKVACNTPITWPPVSGCGLDLTDRVYERKGRQVVLHVLPLLWHLLSSPGAGTGSASGKLCSATAALAATLHSHMGQGLLDRAGSEPSLSARHLSLLQEML
ncbi:hypothetical protein ACOMHN_033140 [Nucella lapillus]